MRLEVPLLLYFGSALIAALLVSCYNSQDRSLGHLYLALTFLGLGLLLVFSDMMS